MSFTPNQFTNKTAQSWQHGLYGFGVFLLFLSWALFQDAGKEGGAFLFGLVGVLIIWGASKIKTKYTKTTEVSGYKKSY